MRARVENITSTETTDEGQPTVKHRLPSDPSAKGQHQYSSQEITDDLIIELAKKDLINIIKLQVRFIFIRELCIDSKPDTYPRPGVSQVSSL